MPSAEVVALEQQLAAAREAEAAAAATPAPTPTPTSMPQSVDTSGMPGGEDSAPVSSEPSKPAESVIADVEQIAETDAIDILQELKAGTPIAQVADKLLDQNGLKSIVKAIGDLAGKVL